MGSGEQREATTTLGWRSDKRHRVSEGSGKMTTWSEMSE